jgi:hypothetical protein
MPSPTKGIYPNWVNDKDIINQVLTEITREGGRLPYSFVINPEHPAEMQSRMKIILDKMIAEKLIIHSKDGSGFLEIDIDGGQAVNMGYRKYNRFKKWDGLRYTLNRVALVFVSLVALALVAGLIYFVWGLFK